MSSLYDINENIASLLNEAQQFDEETPVEIVDEWNARFMEAQGDQKEKLESIMIVRQMALYREQNIKMEMDRLKAKAVSESKLAARMEAMLDNFMKMDGKTEIKTDRFLAKYRKNPPAMVLDPKLETDKKEALGIPKLSQELSEKTTKFSEWKAELKKQAVAAHKAGEQQIKGVTITQGEKLVIK